MAIVAANVEEAIENTAGQVGVSWLRNAVTDNTFLLTTLTAWNNQWFVILTDATAAERTVTNWRPFSKALESLSFVEYDLGSLQPVIETTAKTLWAAKRAAAASRITSGNLTSFVTAWNNTWGAATFP